MNAWDIWILKKKERKMILKGFSDMNCFWIEIYAGALLIEQSETVEHWDLTGKLLERYHWTEYETIGVHAFFTRKISDFRRQTKTYKKPNSRERILELYDRFKQYQEVTLKQVGYEYGVGTEEIKRDIRILKSFFKREDKLNLLFKEGATNAEGVLSISGVFHSTLINAIEGLPYFDIHYWKIPYMNEDGEAFAELSKAAKVKVERAEEYVSSQNKK